MVASDTPSARAASATVSCPSPGSRSSRSFQRWYLDTRRASRGNRAGDLRNCAQFTLGDLLGDTAFLMRKFALCKNPRRLLPVGPAPTARAGPEGLHSQPVLPTAPA